ncbi:hypothetical protein FSP39_017311 [Pinctada imbricata]|uniref:RING-type E3 ubiquitin transferase n=1 Tax=Pinctada imbricata TaxID=66713 RepID=A0AA89BKV9_PINIB|nr:hypothetical protein FSP39_017311 [Pinctada imbricata]
MWCYVSQPNKVILEVEVDQKANGEECLNKVCEILGTIEKDYFGLQYQGPKGEQLWLNMRNRIDRQHPGPQPYRFQLRVKFYVHPHMLQQETTRHQFYLQLKHELQTKTLNVSDNDQLALILALMTQAEYGDQINDVRQFDLYQSVMNGIELPSHDMLTSIAIHHSKLRQKSRVCSEYQMVQEVAKLQNYGTEFHKAVLEGGEAAQVGVGPDGVFVYRVCQDSIDQKPRIELKTKYPYAIVKSAIHDGRKCKLYYFGEDGEEKHEEFRLVSNKASVALYRCITEMHSFFNSDTINNEVFQQRTQDLKDFLASIFRSDVGSQNYVFDVQHTSREVYDSTRRQLLKSQGNVLSLPNNSNNVNAGSCEFGHHSSDMDLECQKLKERIEKLEESFVCRVCMDRNISTVLCPCGHMICCVCAKQLTDCPLCRTMIDNTQTVYISAPVINMT